MNKKFFGAWKVAYADFTTSMMCFFLMMWVLGLSINKKDGHHNRHSNHQKKYNIHQFLNGSNINRTYRNVFHINDYRFVKNYKNNIEGGCEENIVHLSKKRQLKRYLSNITGIKIFEENGMLYITVMEGNKIPIFYTGTNELTQYGKDILEAIAKMIGSEEQVLLKNLQIIIRGYADDIANIKAIDKIKLSCDRAYATAKYMFNWVSEEYFGSIGGSNKDFDKENNNVVVLLKVKDYDIDNFESNVN